MPTSAAISRKLNPPKPPSCMRRSAASKIAVLLSLMEGSDDCHVIDGPCVEKRQRQSIDWSIGPCASPRATPYPSFRLSGERHSSLLNSPVSTRTYCQSGKLTVLCRVAPRWLEHFPIRVGHILRRRSSSDIPVL